VKRHRTCLNIRHPKKRGRSARNSNPLISPFRILVSLPEKLNLPIHRHNVKIDVFHFSHVRSPLSSIAGIQLINFRLLPGKIRSLSFLYIYWPIFAGTPVPYQQKQYFYNQK